MRWRRIRRSKAWRRLRPLRAAWRDSLLLIRQFIWPLLLFVTAVIMGGIIYHNLARQLGEPIGSSDLGEAAYHVMGLTFFQPLGDELPNDIRLELFYFVMPLIGLLLLALGLTDFGVLFFNRRQRSKEWEMAVASTFNHHIVLIGLGHLGFRVVKELHELDQDVVAIELNPREELVTQTQAMGIPVVAGDARREEILKGVGLKKARTLVICTQNDSVNLQIAFKARKLNPQINVVIRIFDEEFSNSIQEQFGFRAMSATGMSAPTFATAAANVDITRPITIEGESFSLAKLEIGHKSILVGQSISGIEQNYDVSIVLLRHKHESDFHPAGERTLGGGDTIAVLAGHNQINRLVDENRV
jgi:voltage-gated potassium channel